MFSVGETRYCRDLQILSLGESFIEDTRDSLVFIQFPALSFETCSMAFTPASAPKDLEGRKHSIGVEGEKGETRWFFL